jgi:tetratricopeptide (TPR) repeat protein
MAEVLEPEDGFEGESGVGQISPAAAIAIGVRKTRPAGKPDPEFDAFLRKQSRLIDLQTEHLHEQRELVLSRLRWGRFGDRMKALLQVMTACVGLVLAVGLAWMAWSASQERGLVIEPFSVPPDLAARGLTGQAIASRMLDRLGEMQNATGSARAPSTYANNWNDEIKVEIPETGVSVSELRSLLVSWLGRQTRITGELYRTPTGIALSARTGTAPAKTHEGGETDLDALVQQTAEDLYGETQPYRYSAWVASKADAQSLARSKQLLLDLAGRGRGIDRVWAYNGLGVVLRQQGDIPGAIDMFTAGARLDPRFPTLRANLGSTESARGHDEAALAHFRAAAVLGRRYGGQFMTPEAMAWYPQIWQASVDQELGDFGGAARERESAQSTDTVVFGGRSTLIETQALDHDLAAAEASFALFPTPAQDASPRSAGDRWYVSRAMEWMALAREDWPGLERAYASVDEALLMPQLRVSRLTSEAPLAAQAVAKLGDLGGAQALIATTPADCYACVRMRGELAAMAHDWRAADRWFAEAVRQGPSLPFAEADWGRALLDKGDAAGAIAKLQVAHRKGPNFADPLETWGEALMAQRDWAGAAGRFAAADKDAPNWGRNHLLWGEALILSGRYPEARAQFEIANGLDLSRPDRAALTVWLDRTARGPLHG